MFPVFTLTTNYPLIAITLRNNIQTLVEPISCLKNFRFNNILFSAVSAIPAIILAYVTRNVTSLVHFTGSYAGLAIEFVVPALLVYFARRRMEKELPVEMKNMHTSPFSSTFWIVLVLFFSVVSFVFNIGTAVYALIKRVHDS